MRVCTDRACGASHFPRTDPAVIMLISDGDRAVLGRKSEWPDGMYSALAGFVEPGESLEEAVAREVKEEVAIDVEQYPLPLLPAMAVPGLADAGLLRGCRFGRNRLRSRTSSRTPAGSAARSSSGAEAGLVRRARSDSIARRLINDWVYGR